MNSSNILEIKDLVKKYEDTIAINSIDLSIEKGKVYGLIGRNGAGKTTLLKLISNLAIPTGGEIVFNPDYIKKMEDISFGRAYNIKYFSLKIKELFEIASKSYSNWNASYAEELIDRFELDTKKKYHNSSSGTQTMTSLVLALSANPKLLLLDEPYVGLDPINREVFYQFLRENYFDGEKTVIISSHMIKEIEGYFEKTILLDKGKILMHDDIETIQSLSYVFLFDSRQWDYVSRNYHVLSKEVLGNRVTAYIYDRIRESEHMELSQRNIEIQAMDLQTLMIKKLVKEEKGNV